MRRAFRPCWLIALLLALPATAADRADDEVVLYRCTAAGGALSVQDVPCPAGQRQQVLRSARPKDPPAPVAGQPPPAAATQAPRDVRLVQVAPPQPMYECVTPDGTRYTSDDGEGNPRWVPTWTYAWIPGAPGGGGRGPAPGRPASGPSPASPSVPPPRGGGRGAIVPYGSVQVRDSCHALPQQEVCSRLRDRRWELIRRYNSALQGEQHAIEREQRGIDARLAQDCGGT